MDEKWDAAVFHPFRPSWLLPSHIFPPVSTICIYSVIFLLLLLFVFHFSSLCIQILLEIQMKLQSHSLKNWRMDLETGPTGLSPFDRIRSRVVGSCGDSLPFYTVDECTYQAVFVRCERNFIIWKDYFLGHFSKLFRYKLLTATDIFSDICIVTRKDTKTLQKQLQFQCRWEASSWSLNQQIIYEQGLSKTA